ncbi:MAG: hypothetical protein ND807_14795 [Vicinamibacterales bacterium]|nr:hypothetical protein [Vicinamibacterales bacterium]
MEVGRVPIATSRHDTCDEALVRDWQHVRRLAGETLREIGLLVLTFAPLDATFGGVQTNPRNVVTAMLIGAILICIGISWETMA